MSDINSYKFTKNLGSYLKYERMNQNISISKIAKAIHLNPSTIVSIEDGKHKASFINIFKIVAYLKIDQRQFLSFIDNELSH